MIRRTTACYFFSIFFCFLFFDTASAQQKKDSLVMNFNLKFGKLLLEPNKNYISENKDTLQIELSRFYISNIRIQYADKSSFVQPNSAHLIDLENPASSRISLCRNYNKEISTVTFNIGIDSLSSVSGALSGDLDPVKGMYWAWQSGFINMKIEGHSKSCKTRKNEFQFHIGGYMKPNYAMRTVELKPVNSSLDISVDVAQIFASILLSKSNSIMIPGKKAMEIADKSISMFSTE